MLVLRSCNGLALYLRDAAVPRGAHCHGNVSIIRGKLPYALGERESIYPVCFSSSCPITDGSGSAHPLSNVCKDRVEEWLARSNFLHSDVVPNQSRPYILPSRLVWILREDEEFAGQLVNTADNFRYSHQPLSIVEHS